MGFADTFIKPRVLAYSKGPFIFLQETINHQSRNHMPIGKVWSRIQTNHIFRYVTCASYYLFSSHVVWDAWMKMLKGALVKKVTLSSFIPDPFNVPNKQHPPVDIMGSTTFVFHSLKLLLIFTKSHSLSLLFAFNTSALCATLRIERIRREMTY